MVSERSWVRAARPRSPYVLDGLVALALSVLCLAAFVTVGRNRQGGSGHSQLQNDASMRDGV